MSVLTSELLVFKKLLLFLKVYFRLGSTLIDKHLVNIEKWPYFSDLKSHLFSWCVKGSFCEID